LPGSRGAGEELEAAAPFGPVASDREREQHETGFLVAVLERVPAIDAQESQRDRPKLVKRVGKHARLIEQKKPTRSGTRAL